MSVKKPEIILTHILESIEMIESRMKGITHDRFVDDIELQDSVVRRLEIVGEATRRLTEDFRDLYTQINWQDPARMRSVLIHAYDEVDIEIVWKTIKNNLPPFRKQIEDLMTKIQSQPNYEQ